MHLLTNDSVIGFVIWTHYPQHNLSTSPEHPTERIDLSDAKERMDEKEKAERKDVELIRDKKEQKLSKEAAENTLRVEK